ncbi:MAG TPA: histidine kinase, partial [Dissulfurispiraceae bacterium]
MVALLLLSGMTAFELTKQLLFPRISIWQSHIMTIVFSSAIATLAALFVIRTYLEINRRLHEEIRVRAHVEGELKKYHENLEELINERTEKLSRSNEVLKAEVTERKRIVEELKKSREQMRTFAAHLQRVREEERMQIARDIHDVLGQELTGVKMNLSWIAKRLPEAGCAADSALFGERVKSLLSLVDHTIRTTRQIATQLRPGILDDLGLVAAIEWQVKDFRERTGISCIFISNAGHVDLGKERSVAVFRILQEALTNTLRHAEASEIHINLNEAHACCILEICDNGKGITDSEIAGRDSLGLLGMRERAFLFGGEVSITGSPSEGTRIMVSIPLGRVG